MLDVNLEAAINTVVALLLNLSLPVLSPFATCAFAALCPGAAQSASRRSAGQTKISRLGVAESVVGAALTLSVIQLTTIPSLDNYLTKPAAELPAVLNLHSGGGTRTPARLSPSAHSHSVTSAWL